jgi:hypothetical protein
MLSRLAFRTFRPAVRFSSDFPQEKQPLIVERLQGDDEGATDFSVERILFLYVAKSRREWS